MYIYIHTYIHTYIHYITLHYITLHYITLHYITLHYITLHYIHTYILQYIYIITYIYIYCQCIHLFRIFSPYHGGCHPPDMKYVTFPLPQPLVGYHIILVNKDIYQNPTQLEQRYHPK